MTGDGRTTGRLPVPYVDSGAAARLFRHKVLYVLLDVELIDEDRRKLILGWRHTSGFSVHNQVVVDAGDVVALERLARHLARPPVSLARMEWDRGGGEVVYRIRSGDADQRGEDERANGGAPSSESTSWGFSRVATQLPEPRKHWLRYYGDYSAILRARRLRVAAEAV